MKVLGGVAVSITFTQTVGFKAANWRVHVSSGPTGLYRGRGADSHVVLLNQKPVIITPNALNVDNPVTLEPLGGGRFRFVAPTGGGAVGEVVRFVEETGGPTRMDIGDGWIDRVQ